MNNYKIFFYISMIGGKLLSEGGFGCVFNPSMRCDGEVESEKFVSKIQ